MDNFLVYLRDAFAEIDVQSNPMTGQVRVVLTKLPPHHSARMIQTLDQLTVNLVAPPEFRFGETYEDDFWIGVHLVRIQPTAVARIPVDGFVSVKKTSKVLTQFTANSNNNAMSVTNNNGTVEANGLDSSEAIGSLEFFH